MAKITYLTVPPELEALYWQCLQSGDRFTVPRIRVKTGLLSKRKKLNLAQRSFLPQIRDIWVRFTPEQQAAWKTADFHNQKHGWRSFVADQTQRIKLGLTGSVTPNAYHQDIVGKIIIESPATELKIIQPHPFVYWTKKAVSGKKNMYTLVKVTERLTLPLNIGISFKSDLVATGEGAFAKYYADVLHFYQGQNLHTYLEVDCPLVSNWTRDENTLSDVLGFAVSYNLYIHLYNVQGEFHFDNVVAEHTSQNWARDILCKNVSQDFTGAFYQVPKHWSAITMPSGSAFYSEYPFTPYPPYGPLSQFGCMYLGVFNFGREEE